jgi:outer membrane protein assembly factor BamC
MRFDYHNLKIVFTIVLSLLVSSCSWFGSKERPVYQGAEYYKNLEVPPDLTQPDTSKELAVSSPTDEALQRFRDNNKLETVITPKFDGIRVVNYAGDSWIEIDNTPDFVWGRLLEFWESEGTEVAEVRPLLGFMETEWTERLESNDGFFRSLLQKLEPDQKDKFRVRVEAFDNGRKTRLFIAHSRIEREVRGEFGDDVYWRTLPSDVEAEREIVARMALFAGLDEAGRSLLVENYRPYSSLVTVDRGNSTALTMKGSMDFVWRRAMRALDRMRMQDIREDKQHNIIHFNVVKLSDAELGVEEDELAETSWLMNLLKGDDANDPGADRNRQYRLEFTDENGSVQIQVVDDNGTRRTDDSGDVSGTALAEQLRDLLVDKLE